MTPSHLVRATELFSAAARRDDLSSSVRALCLKAAADLRQTFAETASSEPQPAEDKRSGDTLIEAALRELGRLPPSEFRLAPVRAAARAGRRALRAHG